MDHRQWDLFDEAFAERDYQYIRALNSSGPKPHLWKIGTAEFKYFDC